jgi:hypothetical protein
MGLGYLLVLGVLAGLVGLCVWALFSSRSNATPLRSSLTEFYTGLYGASRARVLGRRMAQKFPKAAKAIQSRAFERARGGISFIFTFLVVAIIFLGLGSLFLVVVGAFYEQPQQLRTLLSVLLSAQIVDFTFCAPTDRYFSS